MSTNRPFNNSQSHRIDARPRNVGYDENGRRVVGLTSAQMSAGMRPSSLQNGLNGISSLPPRPTRQGNVQAAMQDGTFDAKRQAYNDAAQDHGGYMDTQGNISGATNSATASAQPMDENSVRALSDYRQRGIIGHDADGAIYEKSRARIATDARGTKTLTSPDNTRTGWSARVAPGTKVGDPVLAAENAALRARQANKGFSKEAATDAYAQRRSKFDIGKPPLKP